MKLGDLVERITYYTGIKFIVKYFSKLYGVDCGCDGRQQDWNKIHITRKGFKKNG